MEAISIRNINHSTTPSLVRRSILPTKGICRNLFGEVDHDEVNSELDQQLSKDLKEKTEEWSFDFEEGTPIHGGSLEWFDDTETKPSAPLAIINEDRRVPELHCAENDPELEAFAKPSLSKISNSISTSTAGKAPSEKTSPVALSDRKRKRPKTITDFMKQKKKRRVSYSSLDKKSQADVLPKRRCAKDDLVILNTAKKIRV